MDAYVKGLQANGSISETLGPQATTMATGNPLQGAMDGYDYLIEAYIAAEGYG